MELDGESHVGRSEEDGSRQRLLESKGLTMLRVTNDDVIQHLEAVADGILRAAEKNVNDQSMVSTAEKIDNED